VLTALGDGCRLPHSATAAHLLTYYTYDGYLVANVTCRHGYRFPDDRKWQVIRCIGTSWSSAVPTCRQASDTCTYVEHRTHYYVRWISFSAASRRLLYDRDWLCVATVVSVYLSCRSKMFCRQRPSSLFLVTLRTWPCFLLLLKVKSHGH